MFRSASMQRCSTKMLNHRVKLWNQHSMLARIGAGTPFRSAAPFLDTTNNYHDSNPWKSDYRTAGANFNNVPIIAKFGRNRILYANVGHGNINPYSSNCCLIGSSFEVDDGNWLEFGSSLFALENELNLCEKSNSVQPSHESDFESGNLYINENFQRNVSNLTVASCTEGFLGGPICARLAKSQHSSSCRGIHYLAASDLNFRTSKNSCSFIRKVSKSGQKYCGPPATNPSISPSNFRAKGKDYWHWLRQFQRSGRIKQFLQGPNTNRFVKKITMDPNVGGSNPTINTETVDLSGLKRRRIAMLMKARMVSGRILKSAQSARENIMTVPNLLCFSRIAMSPLLAYLVVQESYLLSCGLFMLAGVTDLLDGAIARRFPSQSSKFGSFIDPLADKCLVTALFLALTYNQLIPVWLACLTIARDVWLMLGGFYIRYISLPEPKTFGRYFSASMVTAQLQPTNISKFNTAFQLGFLAFTLAAPVAGYLEAPWFWWSWYASALMTIISGLSYVVSKDTYKVLGRSRKGV